MQMPSPQVRRHARRAGGANPDSFQAGVRAKHGAGHHTGYTPTPLRPVQSIIYHMYAVCMYISIGQCK
jgi:hypothetical protein